MPSCLALLAVALTLGAATSDQAVFRRVCSACHDYTLAAEMRKTLPDWRDTVQYMMDHGAKATPVERAAIMRYLARNNASVNVNTASAAELAGVLGVTQRQASELIARRPYRSLGDLRSAVPAADLTGREDRIQF